tara:strand:+ start:150 stop:1139 length:990 start_codon:yes stop_codon:yes gene_type:complete
MESRLNRRLFTAALAWLTLTVLNNTVQAQPGPGSKAVFVIVDGIPADVVERVPTPTIDAIAAEGGYGRATVGGPIGEPGETPTISAPGYMSLITGTWANKHNVYENYGISPDYRYWNLFRLVRSEKPELQLAIFSTWTDNRKILLGEGLAEGGNWRFDMAVDGLETDEVRFPRRPLDAHIADIDNAVSREAARLIASEGPDLSWVYLQYTDDVAHKYGESVEFERAVVQMDKFVNAIWRGVLARQEAHDEDWLVIVTTDHGRDAVTGRTHGAQSKRERTIWMATNSQRLTPDFYAMPEIVDIYPSIATHLGITIPEKVARNLDGASFIE